MIVALATRLLWTIFEGDHAHGHAEHAHHHGHDHGHDHDHDDMDEDAHAAAHQSQIEARFAGRRHVSTGEILWFGFTGGLLPCPAAIAVLLICLQLRAFSLGIAMVAAFSVGLAITMVMVGVVAAWGTRKVATTWSGFEVWAERLPYLSGALVLVMGVLVSLKGLWMLGMQ
jgi:nickel/cobalt exporter